MDPKRKRIVVVAVVVALLGGGVAWWKLRGGDPPAAAKKPDPWAAAKGIDEAAILADKFAAHGNAPVDQTPASAAGRITHKADGTGVAGAVIALEPKGSGLENLGLGAGASDKRVVVVADADGKWTAPAVVPGTYVMTATSPGLVPGMRDDLALAAGAHKTGFDLALVGGGITVHGTVSDIGGGPVVDARVRATRDDISVIRGDGGGGFVAITGPDGSYQLTLADGAWDAHVSQDDYTPAHKSFELRDQPVTLDFTLTPGAQIRGQVVSRVDGEPVPGAVVRASGGRAGGDGDREAGSAIADDHGNFTLHGLGSGAIELTATARGYASAAPTEVALGIGEDVGPVQVLVDRAWTISGFVVKKGDEHKGIPGVQVVCFSLGSQEGGMSTQPSGPDGYFEITGVHNASYMLAAIGKGVMPEVGQSVVVDDADVSNVLLPMEVGATLSGKVEPGAVATLALEIDSDKVGLSNMFDVIKAVMVGGSSDDTGKFEIHNAPPGEYTLVARCKDGRTGKLPVTIDFKDQTELVIPLESRAAIAGKVVDSTGAAVAGVEVHARPTGGSGMKIRLQEQGGSVTMPDGSFRIVGLDAGTYSLRVSDDQGELAWADAAHAQKPDAPVEVEITGSTDVTGQELVVEPRDGVIRGVVLGPDHQPAADAWVTANKQKIEIPTGEDGHKVTITVGGSGGQMSEDDDDDDESPWSGGVGPMDPVLTGPDGRFTISRLRRGTYQLIAEGGKGSQRARKVGIKTGDANVVLTLEPLGSLSGVVTAGGSPVADYTIVCRGPAGADTTHVLDATGAYTFARRPPGKYTCTVTSELGAATGDATVKADGGDTRLDLTIGAWASISGTVINAMTGGPMPGLKLAAMGATGVPTGIEDILTGGGPSTDAAGAFTIDRQTPGKGNLMIFDGGLTGIHVIAHKEYTLALGQHLDLGTIKGLAPRIGPAGNLGLTTEDKAGKLTVTAVVTGGAAERAGVKVNDVVAAIDDHPVADLGIELAGQALDNEHVSAGQAVKLKLTRGAAPVEVTVTADAVPGG